MCANSALVEAFVKLIEGLTILRQMVYSKGIAGLLYKEQTEESSVIKL